MDNATRHELRILRAYALLSAAAIGVLALTAFSRASQRPHFEEIDVERINIVEGDGKLRLVISNRSRSPAPSVRGRPFGGSAGTRPGFIFYNDEQTENGGLIFSGRRNPDGTYEAEHSLTFDQYEQDQVIALQYVDANGVRRQGLQVVDRRSDRTALEQDSAWMLIRDRASGPPGPARDSVLQKFRAEFPSAQRLYVGRDRNKVATVLLGDGRGRTRLRLAVDSAGAARIEFLDEAGQVTHRIPEGQR